MIYKLKKNVPTGTRISDIAIFVRIFGPHNAVLCTHTHTHTEV